MIGLESIEHDLLEMKAGTLAKYGKKVEIAEQMLVRKQCLKERLQKILARLSTEKVFSGWFRKKRQAELTERVEDKLRRADKAISKLSELRERYISEFKAQREACGLMDHTFIDDFYRKNSVNQK